MQVNSFNQNNLYGQNPSFKSIIPTIILLNGQEVSDKKTINTIYKALHKSLFKPDTDLEESVKKAFMFNDKEFERAYYQVAPIQTNDRSNMIRHGVVKDQDGRDRVYTFTSGCARALSEITKRARGETNLAAPNAKRAKGEEYYKKMKEFIVKRLMYPRLRDFQGDRLVLLIDAESKQVGKRSKTNIRGIRFTPLRPKIQPNEGLHNPAARAAVQTNFFNELA